MQSASRTLSPEDRRAIADVTVRYCWAIDEGDWADLANVFSEDAVFEPGFAAPIRGRSAIQDFIAGVLGRLDGSQHMVTNHQIWSREGDVRSRCYFHAQHTRRGIEGGANYVVAGIYRDGWTPSPEGWYICSRTIEVLWTEGNAAVVGPAPVEP